MRLRTKLTLFSVALIAVAVIACCFLILSFAQQDAISNIINRGLEDYGKFYSSFQSGLSYSNLIAPFIERSYVLNAFRSIAGSSEYTLRQGNVFLSNSKGFDVESIMENAQIVDQPAYNSPSYKIIHVNGKDFFVVCSTLEFHGNTYSISMVRDISEVMGRVRALAIRCVVAGLVVIAVTATLMWLLVFRALKPIKTLQAGADRLAHGRYDNRISITGKDEFSELARDFNTMANAIESTVHALNETAERRQAFINDLSHELKTPVTSIMLSSETLLNRKLPPEEMNRSLGRIYSQSKWLEQLSQKLMALVLLQGEIQTQPESVPELLEAVETSVADILQENGLSLVVECTIDTLPMDFDLMRAALVNLVDNARKASHSNQFIMLRAYDNIIEVVDHGRGIPHDEIERITEPFYMVDRSRSKKYGGVGLGLALVRQIAEAHGARLVVKSVLGQGTTISVLFEQPQ